MPRIEVDLPTPDGPCHATLHVPADGLPAPAAILFPDAAGPRETFRAVADRLAATGYAVLLPDVYHRLGDWRPFDAETVFSDPPERERLMTMARSVTAEMTIRDTGAFLEFLAARREVAGSRVGVFGYCMGGRAALLVAGRFPDRVGAAASFHGGRLADAADPGRRRCTSPPRRTTRRSRPSSTRAWRPRTPRRECGTRWRSIPRRTGSRYRTTRRTTRRRTSGTGRR